MPYSAALLRRAQEIIDDRRLSAETIAMEHRQSFAQAESAYAPLRLEMQNTVRSSVKAIDMDKQEGAKYVRSMRDRNLAAQAAIRELLSRHGLPEDWLEPHYTCPLCSDKGYVNGKSCSCRTDLLRRLAFSDAGLTSPIGSCGFEDFDLKYYPNRCPEGSNVTIRTHMAGILSYCRDWASQFDMETAECLLFKGETGLGKTFLSLAIAGEVIKKGYSVIYESTQNLMSAIEDQHFGRSSGGSDMEEAAIGCDLLILDDLGTEFSTQFTTAELYNLINTRLLRSLPMIISTNLTVAEISRKYSRRLASRMLGEFRIMEFDGDDIRQLRRREEG